MPGKIFTPKKKIDATDKRTHWERHLASGGGKSKYYKSEKEFMTARKKYIMKHSKTNGN